MITINPRLCSWTAIASNSAVWAFGLLGNVAPARLIVGQNVTRVFVVTTIVMTVAAIAGFLGLRRTVLGVAGGVSAIVAAWWIATLWLGIRAL